MGTPIGGGGKSINVTLRKTFGRLREPPPLPEPAGRRHGLQPGGRAGRHLRRPREHRGHLRRDRAPLTQRRVECKRLISAPGATRCTSSRSRPPNRLGIEKVHCGHKANIMKMTDGLFLERFTPRRTCTRRSRRRRDHRRAVHEPRAAPAGVPDGRAAQPAGRHRQRPRRGPGGRAGLRALGEHRRQDLDLRGGARHGARHRGQGHRQPDEPAAQRADDAAAHRALKQAAIIENALLATLEDGVHTGDVRGKGEPVGTDGLRERDRGPTSARCHPGMRGPARARREGPEFTPPERPCGTS
jgi:hypothetical protein